MERGRNLRGEVQSDRGEDGLRLSDLEDDESKKRSRTCPP